MAELSTAFRNQIVSFMRNTAITGHTLHYVGLFKATTTDEGDLAALDAELRAGTITKEVSGNAYARQLAGLIAPTDGVSDNVADITFPTATPAEWGMVTHCALLDLVSGGVVAMWSRLDVFKTIGIGDTFKFNATELDVTVA